MSTELTKFHHSADTQVFTSKKFFSLVCFIFTYCHYYRFWQLNSSRWLLNSSLWHETRSSLTSLAAGVNTKTRCSSCVMILFKYNCCKQLFKFFCNSFFSSISNCTTPLAMGVVPGEQANKLGGQLTLATRFTSSSYRLGSQVKLSTAKKIHPETGGWFLEVSSVTTNS